MDSRATHEPHPRPSDTGTAPAAPSRRGLLIAGGIAGAAAAAAVALRPGVATPAPEVASTPTRDEPEGYRLTEHVKRYYRTARV